MRLLIGRMLERWWRGLEVWRFVKGGDADWMATGGGEMFSREASGGRLQMRDRDSNLVYFV